MSPIQVIEKPHRWPPENRWPSGEIFKACFYAQCEQVGCQDASEEQPTFHDTDGLEWIGSPTPLRRGFCIAHKP